METLSIAQKISARYLKKFTPTVFDSGIGAKLPKEYRQFYDEWRNTPSKPLHYIPKEGCQWERNENTGEIKRFENLPIPGKIPKELNNCFTGGEMVIQGFLKKRRYSPRCAKFWIPILYRSVVYSEILDKYISVVMTKKAVELIHEHGGLDNYLLQTKACDLKTLAPIRLKKLLLQTLNDKNLPYDNDKNEKLLKKYEKYLIPENELKWYGLSFTEACKQFQEIEEKKNSIKTPLKHIYRLQLIEELKNEKLEPASNNQVKTKVDKWYSKIPGFSKLQKNF